MSNTDLEQPILVRKERLDPNQYTLSLIKEGSRVGLIDQQTMERIQVEMAVLLGEAIFRYTKGESTSVKVETGQSILLSILYTLDACMKSISSPEEGIALLKVNSFQEIYGKGVEIVALCLEEAKRLYQKIKNYRLDIPIIAYQTTIDEALPEFFKNYGVMFNAHQTMASIDYPLLFDDIRMQGIFYIQQYLEKLEMETQFCSLFNIEDVTKVLHDYGWLYGMDYKDALINVFEIVMINATFSVLSGNDAHKLCISMSQYELLREKFAGLDHNQCASLIGKAIEVMAEDLGITRPETKEYMRRFKIAFMPRFLNALDNDSLKNVIIINLEENRSLEIVFDEGNRMDDESFRIMIDEILECSETAEKTAKVFASIHSLGDFIDVLEADCFFEDEIHSLFDQLGDVELSILARIVFIEEIRTDTMGFSLQDVRPKSMDMLWQVEFAGFLNSLSTERLKSIENYIHSAFQATGSTGFLD